jgi:hypothetical protein
MGRLDVEVVASLLPRSKLARFKRQYRRFPTLGMKVDVVTDDNGYWKVAL